MSLGTASITITGDGSSAQSALNQTASAAAQLQTSIAALQSAFGSLNSAVASVQAGMGQFADAMGVAGGASGGGAGGGGGNGGGISAVIAGFGDAIQGAGENVHGFGGVLVDFLNPLDLVQTHMGRLLEVMAGWRFMEYGINKIREFANELMQLPVIMQQTETSWTYTYGMGQTVNPTGNMQIAQGISQQLAGWSARESYNLPFTRQDEMSAISMLSRTNLSPAGVEQYLPVLSDIAATAGLVNGSPVTLQQAAMGVQGAFMGYDRILRYSVGIDPAWLQPYGYDSANVSTLLPSLLKYAEAKHRTQWQMVGPDGKPYGPNVDISKMDPKKLASLIANNQIQDTGAGNLMAHTTWQGAYSSWQDRWQNFFLDVGGYPAYDSPDGTKSGAQRANSPIVMAMNGLNALTSWWDKNQSNINDMAAFLSKTLGQAMSDAGDGIKAFAKAVSDTGIGTGVAGAFENLSHALSDPAFQRGLAAVAGMFGNTLGNAGKNFGSGAGATVSGFEHLWTSLGPGGQRGLIGALGIPGAIWGSAGNMFGGLLNAGGDFATFVQRGWNGNISGAMGALGQAGNDLGAGFLGGTDVLMNWAGNPFGYKSGDAQKWWKNSASPFLGGIGGDINSGIGNIGNWFSTGGLQNTLGTVGHWFQQVGTAVQPLLKGFTSIYDLISGNFLGAWNNLHTALQELHDGPLAALQSWIQTFTSWVSKIPGIGALFSGSTPHQSTPGKNAKSGTIQPGGH